MSQLVEKKYFQYSRRCKETNTLKELFYAHPFSIQLAHAFPKVLLIDCTYKTNRFRLPLLEIVGVTSTGMTFSIASVYLMAENEENYIWALDILRQLLGNDSIPTVIVTDRDKALMNVVASIFPGTRHFLCTWHICRNVLGNCKSDFGTNNEWKAFNTQFYKVWKSNTENEFENARRELQTDFSEYTLPASYVINNWINPYKERFCKAWTNQVMHYGNTTSNWVESQHSVLKKMLGNSMGNFETCWVKIDTILEACHTTVKTSFEKSLNVAQHKFSSNIYNDLRCMVSTVALDKLFDEVKVVKTRGFNSRECKHVLRKVYDLPCAHEIEEYIYADKPIPINALDLFWRKLDYESATKNNPKLDMDNRFQDVVGDMVVVYNSYSQEERLLYLRKMRELANPEMTNLTEASEVNTRGRPRTGKETYMGKDKKKAKYDTSTKRDPSLFEYEKSFKASSVDLEGFVYDVSDTVTSPIFGKKGKPQKQSIIHRRTRSAQTTNFMNLIPLAYKLYVVDIRDIKGDGHCGFRVVPNFLGYGEDNWDRMRWELIIELSKNLKLYTKIFVDPKIVQEVMDALNCYTEFANKPNWFILPQMGHLVANAYNVAVVSLAPVMSVTTLPSRKAAPNKRRYMCIAFVNNNHFVEVFFGVDRVLPPIIHQWAKIKQPIVRGWEEGFNEDKTK